MHKATMNGVVANPRSWNPRRVDNSRPPDWRHNRLASEPMMVRLAPTLTPIIADEGRSEGRDYKGPDENQYRERQIGPAPQAFPGGVAAYECIAAKQDRAGRGRDDRCRATGQSEQDDDDDREWKQWEGGYGHDPYR